MSYDINDHDYACRVKCLQSGGHAASIAGYQMPGKPEQDIEPKIIIII